MVECKKCSFSSAKHGITPNKKETMCCMHTHTVFLLYFAHLNKY